MVLSDIEDHRNIGAKGIYGFALKAGKLQNVPLVLSRGFNHTDYRRADVAANLYRNASFGQNMRRQSGRGGFAIRPCNADRTALQKRGSQLDFADDANAASASGLEFWDVCRNTGGNDY